MDKMLDLRINLKDLHFISKELLRHCLINLHLVQVLPSDSKVVER